MPQKCSTLLFIMNSTCQGTLEQEQYYSILTRDNLAFKKKTLSDKLTFPKKQRNEINLNMGTQIKLCSFNAMQRFDIVHNHYHPNPSN